ncbi:Rcy1p ASCRUDRAFT_81013 [Ascoidea rubescens DSM 1968]|uniref:Exocyst complex component Sec10-like alpha-helical bundle domain-containing protein n=1 Tax=Ascoidea rubescens DSM 1968 TaxID=1344418 RepID=A0A1D2VI23_9ASCO|nr:hypothetical protein ASCRUDRAFT_81013 [Ascoidea rubescens DSM 1968]ODV61298.1 hypothetical protein ASCRUDRAFT_81013 [Ascoidea rubescens DSM 1968]
MDKIQFIFEHEQLPTDFNPQLASEMDEVDKGLSKLKGLNMGYIQRIGPSGVAKKVTNLLSNHCNLLINSAEKSTIDVFQQEVSTRFFNLICKNIKRSIISTEGAITLISDLNMYYSFVAKLKQKSVLPYFVALKTIGQIYLISSDDAKAIGKLVSDLTVFNGIFTQEEIYEFVQRRADWLKIRKDVEKVIYGFGVSDCVLM